MAWATLVRRYENLVYAIARNARLDDDEVDDVFLECFARLVEWVERVEDPTRVRGWLVTTARRLCIDTIRNRKRWGGSEVTDATLVVEDDPLARMTALEERDRVHRALGSLGDLCQQLLRMLYEFGGGSTSSYRVVAERTGMPIGSIGPRRARCLDALNKEYRKLERTTCIPNRPA